MKEAEQQPKKSTYETPNVLLDCPSCSSFIPAQNVNIDKNLAKCDHCDHTFAMDNEIFNDPIGKFVESPPGLDVLKLSSGLDAVMSRRQQTDKSRIFPIVFFAGIWKYNV